MYKDKLNLFVFSGIIALLFYFSIISQFPYSITPDAAMHAEIVSLISYQGYITSWLPYAENSYTYPPLFHYLAWLIPLEPLDAVRILGILVWVLLPVSVYFLVSTYNKEAAIYSAGIIGLVPSLSNVFIYSEYPQALAMVFLVWQWYFLRKEKYIAAAIMTGVIALTHIFIILVSVAVHLIHAFKLKDRKRMAFYMIIPLLIGSLWAFQYIEIANNAYTGRWENIRYNSEQPVFGFWPANTIIDWLFGNHGLTIFLLPLAIMGYRKGDLFLKTFFIMALAFTIFHLPFTQLKINDLLPIPAAVLAGIGIAGIKRVSARFLIYGVIVLMAVIQLNHFHDAEKYWLNPEIAPTNELADAAKWLRGYDSQFSRAYIHQASAWGGILSNKMPLNPDITHLEAFSASYRGQLALREAIRQTLIDGKDATEIMIANSVKYAIAPKEFRAGRLIYNNSIHGVFTVAE